MDTNVKDSMEHNNKNQTPINFAALIQDLKFKIATIVTEMRALFKQQLLLALNNRCHSSSVT